MLLLYGSGSGNAMPLSPEKEEKGRKMGKKWLKYDKAMAVR